MTRRILFLVACTLVLAAGRAPGQKPTLRILPLGNSITRGSWCENGDIGGCVSNPDSDAVGYRLKLFTSLTNAGYSVDYVGGEKFGYSLMSDFDNAGFGGIRDNELANIMETGYTPDYGTKSPGPYMDTYPADIVLLHIGTNDILAGDYNSAADVERILDAIDDYETSPGGNPVVVFLARIISRRNAPCNTDNAVKTFNSRLTNLYNSRVGSDNIVLVDMECGAGIDYYSDMKDQVHPDQTGYDKMADLWFNAINSFNSAPVVGNIPDQVRDRGTSFSQINLDNYVSDAETAPQLMNWSFVPANPQHLDVTIDGSRRVTITPKDPQWSGTESIEFIATDNGKVVEGLAKSDAVTVDFTVNWIPEISGQVPLSIPEDGNRTLTTDDLIIVDEGGAPGPIELIVLSGSNYSVNGTTITPSPDFFGSLTVPVKIRVGTDESAVYNLDVTVTSVNDIPVIESQVSQLSTHQDSCIEIPLTALEVTDADHTYPEDFTLQILSGSNYTFSQSTVCPSPSFYGLLSVRVRVSDGTDLSNTFSLTLEVLSSNPVFLLPENLSVNQDSPYSEPVELSHFDPGSFSWSAGALPGWLQFNTSTRILSGTPGNSEVGNHTVTLSVDNGEISADTSFQIQVINVNDPPVITSTPGTQGFTGQVYTYQLEVTDIDPGDDLFYEAQQLPGWLSLNPSTGLLSGIPGDADVGDHDVALRVTDGELEDTQSFTIEVISFNFPPEILSVPPDTAVIGTVYTYGIQAVDQEGDPLTFLAPDLPAWLTFYPATKVLIGSPVAGDAGDHLVVLAVTDGTDTTFQAYTLHVTFGVSTGPVSHLQRHRIYPNPVTGTLFIELDAAGADEPLSLILYDLAGSEAFRVDPWIPGNAVDLSGEMLEDGLYLYRITGREGGRVKAAGKVILRLNGR